MATVIVIGIMAGLIAVAFPRNGNSRSAALASGATILLAAAVYGLLHQDPRNGSAAINANLRQYHFLMACEFSVLALAVGSFSRFKKIFWAGWAIHAAFAGFLLFVVIWLEFFWHW
jgi:hypothetical protein